LKIEFEWRDGRVVQYSAVDATDAWDLVRLADTTGDEILSAWRDDEPWFGLCTDMREGVA
jgi:hypothetical protein